jgi:hypothetical protein
MAQSKGIKSLVYFGYAIDDFYILTKIRPKINNYFA